MLLLKAPCRRQGRVRALSFGSLQGLLELELVQGSQCVASVSRRVLGRVKVPRLLLPSGLRDCAIGAYDGLQPRSMPPMPTPKAAQPRPLTAQVMAALGQLHVPRSNHLVGIDVGQRLGKRRCLELHNRVVPVPRLDGRDTASDVEGPLAPQLLGLQ